MLPDERFIDGRAVIRAVEEQHGVLVSRADDIYSFSHLTLQEFLTAKHIVDNGLEIEELVTNHLCDRRWREVFLILAGLRRADDLLLKMEKAIHSLVDTPKLQNLLTWVEQITDLTEGDIQPLGKRAIIHANVNAYAYIFVQDYYKGYIYSLTYDLANTYANAYGYSYDFALANTYANTDNGYNLTKAVKEFIAYAKWVKKLKIYRNIDYSPLINNLEQFKKQIPDKEKPEQVHRAFGKKIIHIWLTAFHLTPKRLDLSKSEVKALENYFYANLLMVECKKAAVRVSRETWSEIESQMLLPINR